MNLWSRLRESFWFFPALMCLVAVVLAEGLIAVDRQVDDSDLGLLDFLITRVGEAGSRDLLGAIAGSMLAVASTTFSITIAVLAVSSSTYGPRLVRNFMADRGNQMVLGVFVATFLYSLLVLRSIRVIGTGSTDYFVPHLAVNVAVLLAVLSIGLLVYFVHHISDSVQVWTLAEQVRTDLLAVVDRMYPEEAGRDAGDVEHERPAQDVSERLDEDGVRVVSEETGYVLSVDLERLVSLAEKHDVLLSMRVRPGEHVTAGSAVAVLGPQERFAKELSDTIRETVRIGRARTPHQDVAFPALLLEEMAVRALSPSTNDPYTAINALDALSSGMVAMAGREVPSAYRYDDDGRLRVMAPSVTFLEIVDHLVGAMRFYAVEHPTVLHRALKLLQQVGEACRHQDARRQLTDHADRLVDAFSATSPQRDDLEALSQHAVVVREALLDSRHQGG